MVNEGYVRQVDTMGRVVIPKSLRAKFNLDSGQKVEFYSMEDTESCYICLGWPKKKVNTEEKRSE